MDNLLSILELNDFSTCIKANTDMHDTITKYKHEYAYEYKQSSSYWY